MSPRAIVLSGLCVLAVAMIVDASVSSYEEIGCFKHNETIMEGFSNTIYNVEKCIIICRIRGKRYAGLQNGAFCYCGNSYNNDERSDACTKRCKISGEICGGYLTNSVYRVFYQTRRKMGCFAENIHMRSLYLSVGKVTNVEQCVDKCRDAKRPYAGIQKGSDCWCGHLYNKYGPSTNCNKYCQSRENCGGVRANMVYRVYMPLIEYVGCYYAVDEAKMIDKGSVKSVMECVALCQKADTNLAGLRNGKQCLCGGSYQRDGHFICTSKCKLGGNCGGLTKFAFYKIYSKPTMMIGCFHKPPPLYMPKRKTVKNVKMCLDHCSGEGYQASITGRGNCRCGLKFDNVKTSTGCDRFCPSSENCGGWSDNIVYLNIPYTYPTKLGCFKQGRGKTVFDPAKHFMHDVIGCAGQCKNKKFKYGAAQYPHTCYCTNTYDSLQPSKQCRRLCGAGNECGDKSSFMIYKY